MGKTGGMKVLLQHVVADAAAEAMKIFFRSVACLVNREELIAVAWLGHKNAAAHAVL